MGKRKRKPVRASNHFACKGQCGNNDCEFTAERQSKLDRHLKKDIRQCPLCTSCQGLPYSVYRHFRCKHKEYCNDYEGCPEYDIPDKKTKIQYDPDWFDKHGLSELGRDHFQWLKDKILSLEIKDVGAKLIQERLDHRQIDQVARKLLLEFKKRGYLQRGDDAGGKIRLEFNKYACDQFSLDRIVNDLPHFIRNDDGNIPDVMANIAFVPLGINTRVCTAH